MNTTTPSNAEKFPDPIINDAPVSKDTNPGSVNDPAQAFRINLETGDFRVARIINGIVYDTERSTLVASVVGRDAANGCMLRRLYRAEDGHWFFVHLLVWPRVLAISDGLVWPLADETVLLMASSIVPDKDCAIFLEDWYGAGIIPRNDAYATMWAKDALSGEDLEASLAAIASRRPED